MENRYLELADEYCHKAHAGDLYEAMSVDVDVFGEALTEVVGQHRKRMQGMQSNPKYREQARFFIKHHKLICAVLSEPEAYREHLVRRRESQILPSLELAINGIMADGVVSDRELQFARELAMNLGISDETFNRVIRELALETGAQVPGMHDAVVANGRALGWWDAGFTRLLLDAIPEGPGQMVDVYCRMAWSALTILPRRPRLSYLGIDRNGERIALARRSLQTMGSRVVLQTGQPAPLPLADESVDIVLAVRALQTRDDTRPVLAEAWRVLREGGRCIVVEPDGLAEQFYFDGPLEDYTLAFRTLVRESELIRRRSLMDVPPIGHGSMTLGPQLFARLRHAGFSTRELTVHASQNLWSQPLGQLAKRLRAYPRAIARAHGITSASKEWKAIVRATAALDSEGPEMSGLGGNLLPLFIAVGVKS
ncbi:MAG: SAM-dependent methyltransferase [Kiritimatiellia bacterium]|jgi:SAM-dependent methyltransferase